MNPNAGKERPHNCAVYEHVKTKYVRCGGEHFKECRACGCRVREDMQDHPFWGWEDTCPHNAKGAVYVAPND